MATLIGHTIFQRACLPLTKEVWKCLAYKSFSRNPVAFSNCCQPSFYRNFSSTSTNCSKVLYTETHEWLRVENGIGTIGITDFAQEQLGDIAYVDLPEVGNSFDKGECFATIESVKAASDLYMPVSAEILETNKHLSESPAIVNESPFDKGWLVKIKLDGGAQADLDSLLDEKAYEKIKSTEEQ